MKTNDSNSPRDREAKLTVVIIVSDLGRGGAERQIVAIANGLNRKRFATHIIALSDHVPLSSDLTGENSTLHIVRRRSRFDLTVFFRVTSLIKNIRPNIVHTFLFDADIVGRGAKILFPKFVLVGSERNTDYAITRYRYLLKKWTKVLQEFCIANSSAGAAFNSELFSEPASKYRVVRNGVDTKYFCRRPPQGSATEVLPNPRGLTIGMFASFKRQKNHVLLLKAARRLMEDGYEFTLLFVGGALHSGFGDTAGYATHIEETVERLNLEDYVVFTGPQDEVVNLYNLCDVVVLPSAHEGVPNVVLEAQSCGVPCIVSDVSDNRHIVEHGKTGYVFPPNDLNRLVEYLSILATNEKNRRLMGHAARERMKREFSMEKMLSRIESVYFEVSRTDCDSQLSQEAE